VSSNATTPAPITTVQIAVMQKASSMDRFHNRVSTRSLSDPFSGRSWDCAP
jgi:hypothetical protein